MMEKMSCPVPTFNVLSDEEIEMINESSYYVPYKKGDIIFRQNTPTSHIMYIKSGLVKIYKEGRNKKIIILKISKENQFIGLLSIFGENLFQYSATALEDTEIFYVDIGVFKNLIKQNGGYAIHLMKQLSLDGLHIFEKLINLSHKQLPGRIAEIILYFAEEIFKNPVFEFPLTRQELAELASTTKESLIRTLSEFKNDKIIDLDGRKVEIKSNDIIKILSKLG
ncbi:Crp/Fnr family transcriptional regulator [Bacteroidota bacterium]